MGWDKHPNLELHEPVYCTDSCFQILLWFSTNINSAGKSCSADQSLCNGRNELCIGRGPEYDADDHGYKSNLVIATKQFERAQSLWQGAATKITGALKREHNKLIRDILMV